MTNISNTLAVLGVYFALMAVLSVSVEAIIGWFKVPIPWLQGNISPQEALDEVKDLLPKDENMALTVRVTALNKALKALGETNISDSANIADIAGRVGQATTTFVNKERARRAVIRGVAVVFGIALAWLFQIDTLQILAPLAKPIQDIVQNTQGGLAPHIIGLALSGLGASAGSNFWHDQSARLRQLKDTAQAVSDMTQG